MAVNVNYMNNEKIIDKKELKRRKKKSTLKDKFGLFDVFNYTFLIILSIICLFPVAYEIMLSFASNEDVLSSYILVIPRHFNFEHYKYLFGQGRVIRAFGVSLFITIVGSVYSLILTCLGGYAFSRKCVPGLKIFFTIIVFTMFFGGGIVPFYLLITGMFGLDNLVVLIVPFAINTFNMIIIRNFFNQIPESLIESARLDGASEFRILFQIVLPLSGPGLATVFLWYVIGKWDDWYWASFLLPGRDDLYPIALELRNVLLSQTGSQPVVKGWNIDGTILNGKSMNAAMIVIDILPVLLIYPLLQKYFVKGQMVGGVKE